MPEVFTPLVLAADASHVAAVALAEDGNRDLTSLVSVDVHQVATAVIEARQEMVLAGTRYADAVAAACGLGAVHWSAEEGATLSAGSIAGTLSGALRQILRAERPMLNLLQRASGIATMTAAYVRAVAGTECRVLHTRKTTPGLRIFEVTAVLAGGGHLHRTDLAATLMVKDNHWQAIRVNGRTLAAVLAEARALGATELQVEVESLEQLELACAAGATRVLIDNQSPAIVATWTRRARQLRPGIQIEATGGITLDTIREFATAGADYVSTGSLTHSVPSVDVGLEIQ